MATTPVTPVPAPAETWLQKHERLVLATLFLAAAMFLGNKYIDTSASKASAQAQIATQQAVSAQKSAEQAATTAAQTAAAYQTIVDALQKQNAALAQAVTQRDAILGQQQTAIKTAPLPVVAQQWQTAIGGENDIIASTNGLTVTDDGARRTLTMLVALPVVEANLADETKTAQNLQTEIDAAGKSSAAKDAQISALSAEIVADNAQCKAEVAALKAQARKSKVRWFKIGFVTGFVAGLWGGHAGL